MAVLTFSLADVTLTSTWRCYQETTGAYMSTTPTTATNRQSVNVSGIPAGAKINSAVLRYTIGGTPNTGAAISTINGQYANARPGDYELPMAVTGNGTVAVNFEFRANGAAHQHVQSHSAVISFSKIQLVVDYSPAISDDDWSINTASVEAGSQILVTLYPKGSNTYSLRADFGSYNAEVAVAQGSTVASIPTALDWLRTIPNSTIGEATVTLSVYDGGALIGTLTKKVAITAPAHIAPAFSALCERVLTVGGVTYPDVTGGYVQQKSAVKASISAESGMYGSSIVSRIINIGGRTDAAYNTTGNTVTSPLLPMTGDVVITYKVTDSRGRVTQQVQTIRVEAYTAPKAVNFVVKRVDANGNDDRNGTMGKYSFSKVFTSLGGKNTCAASIKVAGVTAGNIADSGWIVPGNQLALNLLSSYQVQLTLADRYESVTVEATIPSMNVSLHFSADGSAVWVGEIAKYDNAFGVAADKAVYFYGQELRDLIRSIIAETK